MKRLCIVVPYRDREDHLKQFVPHIQGTMAEQNIPYELLVVEQEKGKPFNRAKLLNVGFHFAEKLLGKFDYYCFHDVDMLPIESDYAYCSNPTHLAARAEQFGWTLPYEGYFGGVTIFDRESFVTINGYANEYWGWGAEDDDVFGRCQKMGVRVSRKSCSFSSLHHERRILQDEYVKNVEKLKYFQTNSDKSMKDGLSTLEYRTISFANEVSYKKITVSI